MTGLLAQMDQLDYFMHMLSQLEEIKQTKMDVTPSLVYRAGAVLEDKMNPGRSFVDLRFWTRQSNITIDGQPKQEGYFTPERSRLLLDRLWEQRDLMLTTFAQSPVPGFGTVLLVISSNALKQPNLGKEE